TSISARVTLRHGNSSANVRSGGGPSSRGGRMRQFYPKRGPRRGGPAAATERPRRGSPPRGQNPQDPGGRARRRVRRSSQLVRANEVPDPQAGAAVTAEDVEVGGGDDVEVGTTAGILIGHVE